MVKSVLGFPELTEVAQACVSACLLMPGQFPALWRESHARLIFFPHFSWVSKGLWWEGTGVDRAPP